MTKENNTNGAFQTIISAIVHQSVARFGLGERDIIERLAAISAAQIAAELTPTGGSQTLTFIVLRDLDGRLVSLDEHVLLLRAMFKRKARVALSKLATDDDCGDDGEPPMQ